MNDVAALFVDRRGPYYDMGLDCYDIDRDARTFPMDKPAILHPPCHRWSVLMYPLLKKGYEIGDDNGCFKFALDVLRKCGGILEHPARSLAWKHFDLPKPIRNGWQGDLFSEFVSTEIDQGVYGHDARKTTWLLMRKSDVQPELRWKRCKDYKYQMSGDSRITLPEMPKSRRHITPPAFANEMFKAAAACH